MSKLESRLRKLEKAEPDASEPLTMISLGCPEVGYKASWFTILQGPTETRVIERGDFDSEAEYISEIKSEHRRLLGCEAAICGLT